MTKLNIFQITILMSASFGALPSGALAQDLGYRYDSKTHSCINAVGLEGLSPGYFGECGEIEKQDFTWDELRFTWADLSGIVLDGSKLHGASLDGVTLAGASLANVDLSLATLSQANLSYAKLKGVIFDHAFLSQADLSNTDLSGVDLSTVELRQAKFKSSQLQGVNIRGNENAHAIDFTDAILDKADLRGAYLYGAKFNGASLLATDLSHSVVFDVDFTDAQIDDATLFKDASYNEGTLLPFSDAEAVRRGMRFVSDPSAAASSVTLVGNPDGTCTPTELHLVAGQKTTIILKGTADQMFELKAPDLNLNFMTMSADPVKQPVTPSQKGTFPFTCGVYGAPSNKLTHGTFMVM